MVPFRKKENFQKTVLRLKILLFSKWHYLNVSFFNTTLQKFFFYNDIEKKEIKMVPFRKKENFQITISVLLILLFSKWHYLNVSFFNTTLQQFSFFQNGIEKREIQMVPFRKKENFQKTISRLRILLFSKWHYLNVLIFNTILQKFFF